MANGHISSGSQLLPSSSTSHSNVSLLALPSSSMSNDNFNSPALPSSSTLPNGDVGSRFTRMSTPPLLNANPNINPASLPPLPVSSSMVDILLTPSRIQMADASINPHHASQLRPIFVEHVASVHERAEKKRQRDQELIQEKKRARERVIVFSFCMVCCSIISRPYTYHA